MAAELEGASAQARNDYKISLVSRLGAAAIAEARGA
jgi:hypothetical protein